MEQLKNVENHILLQYFCGHVQSSTTYLLPRTTMNYFSNTISFYFFSFLIIVLLTRVHFVGTGGVYKLFHSIYVFFFNNNFNRNKNIFIYEFLLYSFDHRTQCTRTHTRQSIDKCNGTLFWKKQYSFL